MKLRAKFLIPLLLFSLTFGGYAQFIWLPRISTTIEARAHQDLQAHLSSVAEGLIPLLLENQLANVYESLDALLEQNKEWLSIRLTGDSGQQLYPLDISPPLNIYPKHVRVLPVGFLGSNLAKLEVMVNFWPILTEAEELEKELQFVLLVLLAVYMLMTAGAMEWLVRLRLQQLARAADQLASGNYDTSLPKKTRDEIGDLVASFTTMRDALQVYHLQLKGEIDNHQRTAASLKKEKERATYQATHDSLTGLINRREFERRLTDVQQQAKQNGSHHVLLYMDLDQFKIVNDTCGHIAGDTLLQQLNVTLQDQVRQHDTIARLGGDEFGVLLLYCDLNDALQVAEKLRRAIQEFHFCWDEKRFTIGVSIGVVSIDAHSGDVSFLLSAADSACYMAKEKGRNRVQVYEKMDKELARQKGEMLWATRLVEAINRDKFELFCQPIVPIHSPVAEYRQYEILLRLREDDGSLTLPGAFIPAAERFNLITSVDRWVVDKVFAFLQELNRDDEILFSINLSGPSLGDRTLLNHIEERLKNGDVSGHQLCFEITESAAIVSLTAARHFMEQLKAYGCCFSLDDFGSGMSSFSYLKTLPVNYLKIDGTFVQDIVVDAVDHAMVHAIHQIAQTMGVKTIAEFVENQQILDELERIGVDHAQGYHIRRPFPVSEMAT